MTKDQKVDSQLIKKVNSEYFNLFKTKPEMMVFAPGRVNLIGEHTDYSEGFVLPLAINMGIATAFSPRNDNQIRLYSLDFDNTLYEDLDDLKKDKEDWKEYIKGVVWALKDSGVNLKGFQGVFAGNLPIGAGLSSSAALEVAAAKSFCISSGFNISSIELAKISQKAERDWVGVNVGIMDQLISARGRTGHALMLDCRTLEIQYYPIPESICFVVLDTNTRRQLAQSEYNTRHEEVKTAAKLLGVSHLRDASLSLLAQKKRHLPGNIYHRAKHVITENERVHAFGLAMKDSYLEKMGDLLNKSHQSLNDDFEVSSQELNLIVKFSQMQEGCYGARMTGAGFGGCALAMITKESLADFIQEVKRLYIAETGIIPNIFKVEGANGVHTINQ